ncbi:TolC family protein [Flavihumibacter solisilvae]|uniref:TolC family protein n=1 Tax=Flavihumibacter solisilvae TaxID=1349421 RepID=UPI00068A5EC4|nr:TolC family protein [Flavihumibacter solisilvae]
MKISFFYLVRISAIVTGLLTYSNAVNAQAETTSLPDTGIHLTLQQAVEIAFKNNLELKQAELQSQSRKLDYKEAKAMQLPDVNGSIEHGRNQGRSIDPFTNTYLNQNIDYANYGLNSGLLLFQGLSTRHFIKQQQLASKAGEMDVQQNRDNLTLQVILAYFAVLSAEDLTVQIDNQATVSRKQVERLTILNSEGTINPSQLYDLKGQLANDEISLINTRNQLEAAKLTLSQLLNLPYDSTLRLERISPEQFLTTYEGTPAGIYQVALKELAMVKAAELRKQSAEKGVKAWKGQLWPSLSLNAGLYTNYSSAASTQQLLSSSDVPSGDYVLLNGGKEPVYTTQGSYAQQKIAYVDQFKNNYSTNVNFGIRIPILNGFTTRLQVSQSKLDLQNADIVEKTTRIRLQQSIEQAWFNMTATYKRYKALIEQVNAFQESFRTTEVRFNEGVLNSVDYLVAKNNLDRASTNLIVARYEYVFRTRILDYYQSKPLW